MELVEGVEESYHNGDEDEVDEIGDSDGEVFYDEDEYGCGSYDDPEDVWCFSGFDVGVGGVGEDDGSYEESGEVDDVDVLEHVVC